MERITSLVAAISHETSVSTVLLPLATLLAIDHAARTSLRTWTAVQALSDPPGPETDEKIQQQKHWHRKKRLLIGLGLVAIFAAESWIIVEGSKELIEWCFMVLAGVLLVIANFNLLANLAGFDTVVRRNTNGALAFSIHTPNRTTKLALLLPVIFSSLVTVQTMSEPKAAPTCLEGAAQTFLGLFNTAAVVFLLCNRISGKTMSLRRMTLAFVAYEAVIILLSVPLVFAILSSSNDGSGSRDSPQAFSPTENEDSLYPLTRSFGFPWAAFYVAPVGLYLAACLRFDYHQAATSLNSSSEPVVLQEVVTPTPCCSLAAKLGPGLLVPASSSTPFSAILPKAQRTYFNKTFSITCISYLLIAPALHYFLKTTLFDGKIGGSASERELAGLHFKAFENQVYGLASMLVVMPILALTLLFTARARGESKQLWTYTEVWNKDTTSKETRSAVVEGTIRLEQGESAADLPPVYSPDMKIALDHQVDEQASLPAYKS